MTESTIDPHPPILPLFHREPLVEELGEVPHHRSIEEICRYVYPGIPWIASVHIVTQAAHQLRDYCLLHTHNDWDEVLIIIGTCPKFRMRVRLNDQDYELGPDAAVFIPAGVAHAANVIEGSGHMVVLKGKPTRP